MALIMSRPWKHPKTGIYWLRKRIPDDLRPVLGRLEEKRSLKTRDPAEAKRLLSQALLELDQQWANLRKGTQTLTEREAHEIAVEFHDRWLDQHRDNPSEQTFWATELYGRLWHPTASPHSAGHLSWDIDMNALKLRKLENWCEDGARAVLADRGLVVDETGHLRVAKALAAAVQRASLTLSQLAEGHVGLPVAPTLRSRGETRSDSEPLRFDDLVDGWAAEKKPVEKTVYEWRRVLKQLAIFWATTTPAGSRRTT